VVWIYQFEINAWSALSRWPPEQIKAEYNGLLWYFQDRTCSSRSFVWF